MGCGCGKKRKAAESSSMTSYVLQMPDGGTSEHGSRLEAQAANIKAGGGGKVKPVRVR